MSASTKKKLRKEQNFAQLTEKQLNEQKEAKKLKITTIIFTVIILAVLVVGIVSMGLGAFNNSGIVERNTDALTVGEHKLTAAELNYFYMDGINSFYSEWANNYGEYASTYMMFMLGLDVTKPLDEQQYDEDITFADYFTDAAVNSAISAYTAYDKALAAGTDEHEHDADSVELTMSQVALAAKSRGFANTKAYLKAMYGNGASEESFRKYLEVISVSNHYLQETFEGFKYNVGQLDAYSTEHFDDFSSFSYSTFTVNPSNFLECTASADDKEHVHTDEENAKALEAAKAAAEAIMAAAPTDAESFNAAIKAQKAYAESTTAACSEVKALLFPKITNEKIANWLNEDGRKPGDVTLIENETTSTDTDGKQTTKVSSFTIVLMQERNDNNMEMVNVRHILQSYTGGTQDEFGNVTYSDEEKKTAYDAVALLEKNMKDTGITEDLFAELAKTNSTDPGSASNGGLYENVYPGQMVTEFNDWCFDESRKPGDTGIVETSYGAHLMYFVGTSGTTYRNFMIENTMRNEDYNKFVTEMNENAESEILNTSKLNRGLILGSMG